MVSAESLRALLNSILCGVKKARGRKLSLVKLAALIWAGEEYLYAKAGVSLALGAETLVPVLSLQKAGQLLKELGDEPSATQLCRALAQILPFLDVSIDPNALLDKSETEVSLESLQEGNPVLKGTVQVWLREPSLLKQLRDQREDESSSHAMKYPSLTRSQLRCLSFYLSADDRPDVSPVPNRIERERDAWQPLVLTSGTLARKGDLRIALCPLQGPWRPQFRLVEGGAVPSFVALPQVKEDEEGALRKHLDAILDAVQRRRIHLLVFPELSLDEDTRGYLAEKLKSLRPNPLLAVIAGSFHVWEEGPDLEPFNQAVVWDGRGQPIWEQRKRGPFLLDPRELAHRGAEPFFPGVKAMKDKQQLPKKKVGEGIRIGGELAVVETTLGRIVLLICADALEPKQGYVELAGRVQADLVFIVAMSPKTWQFDVARSIFVKQDIGVIFVNMACTCRPGHRHKGEMALVDLSLQESQDLPPTRWSWRIGAEPEWYQYGSPEGRKAEQQAVATTDAGGDTENWQPLNKLPVREGEEPAASLLEDGLGLVLSLGHFFRGLQG